MSSMIKSILTALLQTTKVEVTNDPTAGNPAIALDLAIPQQVMNNTTTVDAAEAWTGQVTMVAGGVQIDMTNLTQLGLQSPVSANAMKLRAVQIFSPVANANSITLQGGASNPYASAPTIGPIPPGGHATVYLPGITAISGTSKTLQVTGTGTDKANIHLLFGVN